MMNSQEDVLKQEQIANEPVANEIENETAAEVQNTPEVEEKKIYTSKQEVLDRVKEIAHSDDAPVKEEVDLLKTVFYKLHIA